MNDRRSIPIRMFTLLCCMLISTGCYMKEATSSKTAESLRNIFEQQLKKGILDIWYPRAIDIEKGGFFSNFTYDWQPLESQEKMIVSQARHTWTTSRAAIMLGDTSLLQAATHGFRFLKEKMWDARYGGFYTLVDREGNPAEGTGYNAHKRTYGNAFAIYALSAYYAASQDQEALQLAVETFRWIDRHAFDSVHGGYFPALTREGTPIHEEPGRDIYFNVRYFYKDQNTSIHILEAFAELYQVWPDDHLRNRLQHMLDLIAGKMVSQEGYLRQFFYHDFNPFSLKDSSDAILRANFYLDHVSFGHDIETAYLMLEASHALGGYKHDALLKLTRKMVDHTLQHGFDPQKSGIYEQGYYFGDSGEITIVDEKKNWWAQAEGLNALLMFSRLFPGESQYEREFVRLWDYVNNYIIDHEHGEWFAYGTDTYPEAAGYQKGQIWKASYHNGRAMMNIVRMLNGGGIF
jgi:cellobiose epimerase